MNSAITEYRLKRWLPLFEDQAKSGLNKKTWCNQNGIKKSAFFRWQRVYRSYLLTQNQKHIEEEADQETTFVELSCYEDNCQSTVPVSSPASEQIPGFSITISRNGFLVSLDQELDEDNLARVLRAIAHAD